MKCRVFTASMIALLAAGCAASGQHAPAPAQAQGSGPGWITAGCPNLPVSPNPCTLPPLKEDQARTALAANGYRDIRRLAPVGSYWEAEAATGSGPVTVYVLGNGRVLRAPPAIGTQ